MLFQSFRNMRLPVLLLAYHYFPLILPLPFRLLGLLNRLCLSVLPCLYDDTPLFYTRFVCTAAQILYPFLGTSTMYLLPSFCCFLYNVPLPSLLFPFPCHLALGLFVHCYVTYLTDLLLFPQSAAPSTSPFSLFLSVSCSLQFSYLLCVLPHLPVAPSFMSIRSSTHNTETA